MTYLLILFVILGVMSFSGSTVERWRGGLIALLSPLWSSSSSTITQSEEIQRLQIENQHLRKELARTEIKLADKQHILAAKVIFRSFDSWNSSLWINKGAADNGVPATIVKNSPVVVGKSIVGVIDYVGKHQSRVRLITDSGLTPSVRAVRGEEPIYLAKGELQGSSGPLWRRRSQVLRGTGFNYDFADDKGEARDLRTGQIAGKPNSATALIKVDDVLVTTGMDGIFPEGWQVATVTKIEVLKEGDYCYELEALPTAGNLLDLSTVFVIPPLGYDTTDRPN